MFPIVTPFSLNQLNLIQVALEAGVARKAKQIPAHAPKSSASSDRAYFALRAEDEVNAAQRATHPAAVAAHYQMSRAYLELAYPDEPGRTASE